MASSALDFTPAQINFGQNYLLLGTDAWLTDSIVDPIRKQLKKQYSVDVIHIYGDEIKAAELNDVLDAYSIFSSQKLIILRNAESLNKKALTALSAYFKSPSDSQSLVIITEKADAKQTNWKIIRQACLIFECQPPKSTWIMERWLSMELRKAGKQMDSHTQKQFLARSDLDYASAYSELQKLLILLGDRKVIKLQDVEKTMGSTRVGALADFYRALGAKNLQSALQTVERMLDSEWAALIVLFQINKFYSFVHKILLLRRNHISPSEILDKHLQGLYDTQKKEFLQYAQKYSLDSFEHIYKTLLETDSAIKLSKASDHTLLELCLIRIISCK